MVADEMVAERASVLASILAVLLLLVALLWQRVEPVAPERVALEGREGLRLAPDLEASLAEELGWGSTMLLTATPAAVVLQEILVINAELQATMQLLVHPAP
jgi:hypothetical protein